MKLSDAFPSNYLAAAELNDEFTAPISHLQEEDIGANKDRKFVLYFKGVKKGLVLNVTNWKTIEKAFGDSDNWGGQKITLYPTETNFKGEMVQAIRVRIPRTPSTTQVPWEDPFPKNIKTSPPPQPKSPEIAVGSQLDSLLTEAEAMARQGVERFRDWRDHLGKEEHTLLIPHLHALVAKARTVKAET